MTANFVPFHANLIFAGGYNGRVMLWDNRVGGTAQLKSQVCISGVVGHSFPIQSLSWHHIPGLSSFHTADENGRVCNWSLNSFPKPTVHIELLFLS